MIPRRELFLAPVPILDRNPVPMFAGADRTQVAVYRFLQWYFVVRFVRPPKAARPEMVDGVHGFGNNAVFHLHSVSPR